MPLEKPVSTITYFFRPTKYLVRGLERGISFQSSAYNLNVLSHQINRDIAKLSDTTIVIQKAPKTQKKEEEKNKTEAIVIAFKWSELRKSKAQDTFDLQKPEPTRNLGKFRSKQIDIKFWEHKENEPLSSQLLFQGP